MLKNRSSDQNQGKKKTTAQISICEKKEFQIMKKMNEFECSKSIINKGAYFHKFKGI